jgi:hypothetical protein
MRVQLKNFNFFFLVGHYIVGALNPVVHLTCYACLVLALVGYVTSYPTQS